MVMLMTHTRAKGRERRSLGGKVRVEVDGRTDGQTDGGDYISSRAKAVGKYTKHTVVS